MKISITHLGQNEDCSTGIHISTDSCIEFHFNDGGQPEDSLLCRDYNDVYKIVDIAKAAWEAGASGKSFSVETMPDASEDDFFELSEKEATYS